MKVVVASLYVAETRLNRVKTKKNIFILSIIKRWKLWISAQKLFSIHKKLSTFPKEKIFSCWCYKLLKQTYEIYRANDHLYAFTSFKWIMFVLLKNTTKLQYFSCLNHWIILWKWIIIHYVNVIIKKGRKTLN